MTRLYLIRHGENLANLTKEFSCRKVDYSLTPKGIVQAQQTARYLQDKGIDAVYSSPLRRALETAQYLAGSLGQEVHVLDNFRELDVGDLEGQPPTPEAWAVHNQVLDAWRGGDLDARFPGGESFRDVWRRAGQGYRQVVESHPHQTVAVVAHGGIFATTVRMLCAGIDLDAVLSKENHNCSISEVEAELRDGELHGQLVDWAACDHMSGEAAQFVPGSPTAEYFEKEG